MSTISILLTIFFILFFLVLIMTIIRNTYYSHPYDVSMDYDHHDETTTTVTTTTVTEDIPAAVAAVPEYNIVGVLVVQTEGTQHYVIDPADSEKIWVNTTDDMYRDADGKIWKLK
jgi:hypothetical protein